MLALSLAFLWPVPVVAALFGPVTSVTSYMLTPHSSELPVKVGAAPTDLDFCEIIVSDKTANAPADALAPCRDWFARAQEKGRASMMGALQ